MTTFRNNLHSVATGASRDGVPVQADRAWPIGPPPSRARDGARPVGTRPLVAISTRVASPALQDYIRRHPFLAGPDGRANRRALAAVRAGIRVAVSTQATPIDQRPTAELRLPAPQETAAVALLRAAGVSAAACANACADHGWRVAAVPADARAILCLAGGAGEELALLRARAPRARIVAIGSAAELRRELLDAVGAEFIEGPPVGRLQGLPGTPLHSGGFDVVFSRRVLEHLFDPDQVLQLLARCLQPGGTLVLGLPLDGDPCTPLYRQVVRLSANAKTLHLLDMGLFDAGHPWKTNAADLSATLQRAGFGDIRITQRADAPFGRPRGAWFANAGWIASLSDSAYFAVFGLARATLRALFPVAPYWVCRGLVAIERRAPFGANRLKNRGAPDVVATAVRAERTPIDR